MFAHALLTLYRSMTRHRLYAALNILGLSVGIAAFLILMLFVRFQTSFEQWLPGARGVYMLRATGRGLFAMIGTSTLTPPVVLEDLQHDDPRLIGTRAMALDVKIADRGKLRPESLKEVDPNFFRVLDLPLVSGNKATALDRPDNLLISESKARQYFGTVQVVGRTLAMTLPRLSGAKTILISGRIVGVLKDMPANSDLTYDFVTPISPRLISDDPHWRSWGTFSGPTYLRLTGPAQARALDTQFDAFVDRHAFGGENFFQKVTPHTQLQIRTMPLTDLHLMDAKDAAVVAALGGVGLLTLVIAALNYVNLATARSAMRATEVALRKVMGATRGGLMVQFLAESVAVVLLAAVIALALCELALPGVNAIGGLSLKLRYDGADGLLLFVLATAVIVGLTAGAYPALILARFQPAQVLSSTRGPARGRMGARIREGLVTLQFAAAIELIAGTAVVVGQMAYLKHGELGFQREGLIIVPSFGDLDVNSSQRASLVDAWRALPGVASVAVAGLAPGINNFAITEVTRPGARHSSTINFVFERPGFFSTYGVRLLAGRLPDLAHGGDTSTWSSLWGHGDGPGPSAPIVQNIVLNATAASTLGYARPADALGAHLSANFGPKMKLTLVVVGVVPDIRFQSPRTKIAPIIYSQQSGEFDFQVAAIRTLGADPAVVLQRMRAAWDRIAPQVVFDAKTADASLESYYRQDEARGGLFLLGAGLAVFLACLGLYGLAAFSAERRSYEIGIRKTLGASTGEVLRLLIGQFLRPVVLANLVAWPVAFVAMRAWLLGFDQRVALTPVYFLAATALALAVAALTVVGQALRVAAAVPAKALRHP